MELSPIEMSPVPGEFCFVHAADLHLDTPFSGLRVEAEHVADALVDASLRAFDAVVSLAIARHAAFVVIAGDVYDGAERGVRAQLRFHSGLEELSAEQIPVLIVHGNHDPVDTGWSAISSWPDGITVFGASEVGLRDVEIGGTRIATVQGISYAQRVTTENLSARFERPDGPGLHVGLLHCNVGGPATGHPDYSPCTLEDLRRAGLDYWALGHVHTRSILSGTPYVRGEPFVVYPGNTQGRSPKPAERGAKGAVVVTARDANVNGVEFVACDEVRFAQVGLDVTGVTDLGSLRDSLVVLGATELETADGRSLVLRATLSGRGSIHADLGRPQVLEGVIAELRESAGDGSPFLWWDTIESSTRGELSIEEIRHRGDFAADLLSIAGDLADDPETLRALLARLSVDGVPRGLSSRLEELVADDAALARLLDDATSYALDLVEGGTA